MGPSTPNARLLPQPHGREGLGVVPEVLHSDDLSLADSEDIVNSLGLELAKRPEPRGEIDGWERYPAKRYRIADTLLADLEAASHRVADIDSHIEEQSRAGEMG